MDHPREVALTQVFDDDEQKPASSLEAKAHDREKGDKAQGKLRKGEPVRGTWNPGTPDA